MATGTTIYSLGMMMMDDNTKERNTLVFVYIAIIELTFYFYFFTGNHFTELPGT